MGLIIAKSFRTKKSTAAFLPAGLKTSRISSMRFMFCSALSRSDLTRSEVSFEAASCKMSSSSSSRLILSSASLARI